MSIHDRLNNKTIAEIKEKILSEDKFVDVNSLGEEMNAYFSPSLAPKMKQSEYLKAGVGWVYGCVGVIADEVAGINLTLKQTKNGDEVEVDDHEALDLIYRANNAMTRFDLINTTFQYLELTGEAPWFVGYGKNKRPETIILLRPDRLTVKPGTGGEMVAGYKYKIHSEGGVKEIDLEPWEVIPLKYVDPDNPLRGKGPLQAAARTIDLDDYSERWNSQFFRNSASPHAAFMTDKTLASDVRKRLEKKLKENYTGVENSHKTMILESGLKFQSMSLSQKDMDFIEQQRFSRDKIMAIFRVPKSALGLTEDVNRANAEATDYVFAKRTIRPKMIRFVEQLNEFFLPLFAGTEKFYFDFQDPVPENVDQLVARTASGVSVGYMTINEARELMGLDPIEGGDILRDPTSFQPVEDNGKQLVHKKPKARPTHNQKHYLNAKNRKGNREKKQKAVIESVVSESIVPIVFNYLKNNSKKAKNVSFVQKSVLISGTFEEAKAAKYEFQEKQLKKADEYEAKFIKKLNSVFNEQKQIVLHGLDNGEKVKLDPNKETNRYVEALKAPFVQLLREQADMAYKLIGISKSVDEKAVGFTSTLVDYFEQRTYKIAPQITRETNDKLAAAFATAAEKEESIPQIKSRISELFDNMEGYRSERIARTETIRGSNFASEAAWKESGVVDAKEWLTTKDERTDDECNEMDGRTIMLGDKFFQKGDTFQGLDLDYEDVKQPPLHVNCRCTLIPVVSRLAPDQWRPNMSAEQAKVFTKDSKIKATYFHGTDEGSATQIGKDGFNLTHNNITGDGIYLAGSKSDVERYADAASKKAGKRPAILATKVNVKNVKTFSNGAEFVEAVEKQFGDITKEKASAYMRQFDAVLLKETGRFPNYLIITDPRKVVTLRPE